MYIKKRTTQILLIFLIFISFQINAGGIDEANWYLSVDIDQLQNNEVFKMLKEKQLKKTGNIPVDFKKFPDELSHITVYGNAKGSQDATAVVSGDFSTFSIGEYIVNFIYTQDDVSKFVKESTEQYHNHQILTLTFDGEEVTTDGPKSVYFSKINNDTSVISLNQNEVKNWINSKYENLDVNKGSLFSVVVNVESALAHMGMNIDDNNHMMNSEIFQKVEQISASVSEVMEDILIEIALSTKDQETATQIEQVINGLVAMNNLSGTNQKNALHKILMQNLNIHKDSNNILISSFAPISEIKKIEASKQIEADL